MPTLAQNKTARRNRPVTTAELREFREDRTAKEIAAAIGHHLSTVYRMADAYRLPLAKIKGTDRQPRRQDGTFGNMARRYGLPMAKRGKV